MSYFNQLAEDSRKESDANRGDLLVDNFRGPFLNILRWDLNGKTMRNVASTGRQNFRVSRLLFDPNGLRMKGTVGYHQMTGLQSRRSFTPPFTVKAKVKSVACYGNSFVMFLVGENLKDHLDIFGNVSSVNGVHYGIWASDSRNALQDLGTRLFPTPEDGKWYTLQVSISGPREGIITLQEDDQLIYSEAGWEAGAGPFHLILGQWEGEPAKKGPNEAIWNYVRVYEAVEQKEFVPPRNPPRDVGLPIAGSVHIIGGTGDFAGITRTSNRISAKRGQRLRGTVKLATVNRLPDTHVAPLVGAQSWGPHRWGYWTVNKWIRSGEGTYESNIDVTLPTDSGTYRILFAFAAELEGFYVASGTNWTLGHPEWDDGNDIADLNAGQLAQARDTGFIINKLRTTSGFKDITLPLDFIELVVE